VAANGFDQIVLERCALSNVSGTAQLSLNSHSELNALVGSTGNTGNTETVRVTTLDERYEHHHWGDVDFVKLDAEGEELNILQGGKRFFLNESPLVQYEVKAGRETHLNLVEAFADLGYKSYRLVPGLDLLVPFTKTDPVDSYLLNLFACKPDRAEKIASRGFMVQNTGTGTSTEETVDRMSRDPSHRFSDDWLIELTRHPYGEMCAGLWRKTLVDGMNGSVREALSWFALSRDSSRPTGERYTALCKSFLGLKSLCEAEPGHLRLSSLARVAAEFGARSVAVQALGKLCNMIFQQRQVDLSEPFLAPGARFDSVSPRGAAVGDWVAAAAVEELERKVAFSSFYTGESSLQRLNIIRDLGFGADDMERRARLVKQRLEMPDD
jgi:hypothetical protein